MAEVRGRVCGWEWSGGEEKNVHGQLCSLRPIPTSLTPRPECLAAALDWIAIADVTRISCLSQHRPCPTALLTLSKCQATEVEGPIGGGSPVAIGHRAQGEVGAVG